MRATVWLVVLTRLNKKGPTAQAWGLFLLPITPVQHGYTGAMPLRATVWLVV